MQRLGIGCVTDWRRMRYRSIQGSGVDTLGKVKGWEWRRRGRDIGQPRLTTESGLDSLGMWELIGSRRSSPNDPALAAVASSER